MQLRVANSKAAADHTCIKKLKLAEVSLPLQQAQVKKIKRSNEMMFLTAGSSDSSSELTGQYFALRQKDVMQKFLAKQTGRISAGLSRRTC